jgi:S-adenosylmethionine uptake transporter
MLYPMVANTLVMGIALPFVYVPMPVEHLGGFLATACLGLLGGMLVIQAYRRSDAAVVAPMQYSQLLWALLIGYLAFGETVGPNVLYGAAIVIGSGLYILMRESTAGVSVKRPILKAFHIRPDTGQQPRIGLMLNNGERSADAAPLPPFAPKRGHVKGA